MLRRTVIALSLFVCCCISVANAWSGYRTGGITEFQNRFPLRFLCNYSFVALWSSEFDKGVLESNRPVDVGIGFGYGDFYLDLIFALPFTTSDQHSESLAFETGLDFFPGDWWIKAKYRRYSGFSTGGDDNVFVDLWERDMYLSALWMATANGSFSPRVAFFLDRRQLYSAGSLILGGRVQSTLARDRDDALPFYQEERVLRSTWVNAGYSYTWILSNSMFVNLWGVAGVAIGNDTRSDDFILLPDVTAKFAYGRLGETWSWNIVLETEYLPVIFEDHWEQRFVSAFKILVVRRF